MAYIRKVEDKWRAEVERAGKRVSKRFRTKREAELWAAQQETAIVQAAEKPHFVHTVQQGVDRYIMDVTRKKASQKQETLRLGKFLRDFPVLAGKLLADVRTADLVEWREARLQAVSAGAVLREVTPLRHMFKLAGREWGWMPRESPFDGLGMPAKPIPRQRRISASEIRRVMRSLGYVSGQPPTGKTDQVAWAFLVSLHTAMRGGEVLGLKRSSVDLAARVVTLKEHKTAHQVGVRQIPITRAAARVLARLDKAAKASGRDDYFTVSAAVKDTLFRRHTELLGIHDLHFHDARAEALTQLARKVDVMVLARISGHTDLKILHSTYYRATAAEIAAGL